MIASSYSYAYAYTTYPFERRQSYMAFQRLAEEKLVGLWAPGVCGNPASAPTVVGATSTAAVAGASTTAGTTSTLKVPSREEPVQVAQAAAVGAGSSGDAGVTWVSSFLLLSAGLGWWWFVRRKQ